MAFRINYEYAQYSRRKRLTEEREAFFIPGPTPGTVDLKSPYDWKLANYLKSLGGPTWHPSYRVWHMSEDMITPVSTMMESIHIAVKPYTKLGRTFETPENDDRWEMLMDTQREGVQRILRRRVQLLRYDMGLGKALLNCVKVLTSNGWKPIGDVRIEDKVASVDGSFCSVLGVFPQGKRDVWRVTFSDGTHTDCSEDHLWSVSTANTRKRGQPLQVQTTKELLHSGLYWTCGAKYAVPYNDVIQWPGNNGAVMPYLVGVLLGDGTWSEGGGPRICLHETKFAILERLQRLYGKECFGGDIKHVSIAADLWKELLWLRGKKAHEKYIPDNYLQGHIRHRVELLRGLMDTDGYVSKNGTTMQYTTVSSKLADGVVELVRSLGLRATVSDKIPTYHYNGEKLEGQRAYTITISGTDLHQYVTLPKKLARLAGRKGWMQAKSIISIENLGYQEEMTCIKVDHPSELFIAEGYVVTHNTPTALTAARYAKAKSILIVCPASVKKSWESEIAQWWEEVDDVFTVWTGKDEFRTAHITICNYELLKVVQPGKYDFIILDEAQNINNGDTIRATQMRELGHKNPSAYRVALSGTPVTSEPIQWHGIMSWLLPGCWGSIYAFAKRYFYVVEQPHFEILGLREDFVEEFNYRLTYWVHDVCKDDVAEFKKNVTIETVWETSENPIYRPTDMTHEEFDKYAISATPTKVRMAQEWARPRKGKRMAILTHLRRTAAQIAEALTTEGFNVYQVDGSIPPARRWKVLSEAREQEDAVLVTTMHAVKTGINILTVFEENVAYAELYWAQEPVSQSIARFNRWTSKNDAHVTFLCLKGTVDEAICRVLKRRISEANALTGVSREEKKIVGALEKKDDRDVALMVLAELSEIVTDEYGVMV